MGELKNKRIVQSRSWHDPKQGPIPTYDYDYTYPITVYDAVKRTIDENATNLTDELEGIYRLLKNKQDIILPGTPGKLMTWSGIQGQIGSMDITRAINEDPVERSHAKLPTERAVGDILDTKATILQLYQHTSDSAIHITDVERSKWNSMTPHSTFNSHTSNAVMHITNEERKYWNSKADGANLEMHLKSNNNPHNVTAHQTGTYTRKEIDEQFANLRETFFNYLNIRYDERNDVAVLDKYAATNWNPNYVLPYGETLPDVIDPNKIYFAVKPATDFNTNETQDVIIYIKKPGLSWVEIGSTTLRPGDLLIRFPDTRMYVWMQGRFIRVFTDSKAEEDDLEGQVWRPKVTEEGEISWVLSKETKPPTPQNIKGKDGYTPIKGVDYVDGKDGEGVPIGGSTGEFLIKNSDENYDTTWKAPSDIFKDLALAGLTLPENLVEWDKIKGRPFMYLGLGDNDNGFITQKGVTHQFEVLNSTISELTAKVTGPTGIEPTRNELYEHIHDYSNPHRVNAADIGAVPTATFNSHITNMNNPHNVTKEQIGLSKVDNTSDMDKPVSTAVEAAIKAVSDSLESLSKVVGGSKYITNARWDGPTNILEFTFKDGEKLNVEIPITDALSNITFDKKTKELVIQLPNGTENRINISSLIKVYKGSVSANIQTVIENDDIIKSTIVPNTIGEMEIQESVHLKSSPTTTTQPVSDRSDRIATTKFVGDQVINNLISYETDRPLSANMGRVLNSQKADLDDVVRIVADMKGTKVIDELNSVDSLAALSANMGRHLDLIKAPRVHTSPFGSTFGRATISLFGHAKASDSDPLMDGTVFRGTDDGQYARGDHRHPTDNTRAPLDSPDFTGQPKTPTPADDADPKSIVNIEWVTKNMTGGGRWGVSVTPGSVSDKIVNISADVGQSKSLLLRVGSIVIVKFNETNIAKNTRMNVANTGMIPIIYQDRPVEPYMIEHGIDHLFVYDGSSWRIINPSLSGSEIFGGSNEIGGFKVNPNHITGYLGYTTEGFGGQGITEDGEVDRALVSIPFRSKKEGNPRITISNGMDDWALRMGDNTVIPIQDPVVIYSNKISAVVQFSMRSKYPSNSPCALVIRRPEAFIKVESSQQEIQFVPVQNIGGIPTSVPSGSRILLTQFYVLPINATNQSAEWSLKNVGTTGASILNNTLIVNKSGTLILEVRIKNGASKTSDFVQQISINVIASQLTIIRHPEPYVEVSYGYITESLTVNALAGTEELTYQWYSNDNNSNTSGTLMPGEVNPTLHIPTSSAVGTKYYFCEVKIKNDPDGMKTRSACSRVVTIKRVSSIMIINKPSSMLEYKTLLLETRLIPSDSTHKRVTWTTSDKDVAIVNDNGELFTYRHGVVKIKASIDNVSDEFELQVKQFIGVTTIKNIPSTMESGTTVTLNPVIEPSDATNRTIVWSIVEKSGNTVSLTENVLKASGSGFITIRATIKGDEGYIYTQDFDIMLTAAYVPVTNITLTSDSVEEKLPLYLSSVQISPTEATNRIITWSIVSDGNTNANITSDILTAQNSGTVRIRATIKNGKSKTEDFVKDFNITIKKAFVPVQNISNIPSTMESGTTVTLNPVIEPATATNRTIDWSVSDQGIATANIVGNKLTATGSGSIAIRATITGNNGYIYQQEFRISLTAAFVPVTDIELENTITWQTTPLYLNRKITPIDATRQFIEWSIVSDGGTNTNLNNDTIVADNIGTVTIRATIKNGKSKTEDFVKDFNITIKEKSPNIKDIVLENKALFGFNKENSVKLSVYPAIAKNYYDISYKLTDVTNDKIKLVGDKITANFNSYDDIIFFIEIKAVDKNNSKNIWTKLEKITLLKNRAIIRNIEINSAVTFGSHSLYRNNIRYSIDPTSDVQVQWSIENAGSTGATIEGNKIKATSGGIVVLKATVKDGLSEGNDYTKTFNINIVENDPTITSVSGIPSHIFLGETWSISSISVTPSNPVTSLMEGYINPFTDTAGTIMENGPVTMATFIPQKVGILGAKVKWYSLTYERNIQIRVIDKNNMNYITDLNVTHKDLRINEHTSNTSKRDLYMLLRNATFIPSNSNLTDDLVEYTIKKVIDTNTNEELTTSAEIIKLDPDAMKIKGVTSYNSFSKVLKIKNSKNLNGHTFQVIIEARVVLGKSLTEDFVKTLTFNNVNVIM